MELKFRSRDNTVKSRVFCLCAKGDEKLFDDIAEDILRANDCAIFYCDEVDDFDEYGLMLSRIQLLVFPITANLLFSEDEVVRFTLDYAKKNAIPLLPLMYGTALEDAFNEKIGEVQYLDKFANVDGVIPYEKKLSDFLSRTLVSEDLVEKIRASFDAYIFLSYRKKDRKHANEVMRLIHEQEFARDIAVWFDEFLIPGENFNDAIKSALIKSDLFTLVLTPNMVGEDNYVREIEYPEAVKNGKPVLAVEVTKINNRMLNSAFSGLNESVKKEGLSSALMEKLKHLAIRENDTPIHNYYIALAYLYGIDLEIDRARALRILEDSAQNNCVEAMEKLCSLYLTGEAGVIDIEKSAYYGERAVEIYLKADDARSADIINSLANSYLAYNGPKREEKRAKATALLLKAVELYEKFYPNGERAEEILSALGFLLFAVDGKMRKRAVKRGLDYIEKHALTGVTVARFRVLVLISKMEEGRLLEIEDDLSDAMDEMEDYARYDTSLALDYAQYCSLVAEYYTVCSREDEAKEYYARALNLARQAYEVAPLSGRVLAEIYEKLGLTHYAEREGASVDILKECAKIVETLLGEYDYFCEGVGIMGLDYLIEHCEGEEREKYASLMQRLQDLYSAQYGFGDEEVQESEEDADAQALFEQATALQNEGKHDEAIALLLTAKDLTSDLTGLTLINYSLATNYFALGRRDEAILCVRDALTTVDDTPLVGFREALEGLLEG